MGEKIRKYRTDMNITQRELADKLFVTQQAVQRWEKGNSFPQADKVVEIADALDISVSDLYFNDASDTVMRYIVVDITDLLSVFLHNLDILCIDLGEIGIFVKDYVWDETDNNGRLKVSVGLDSIEYSAYSSLKKHDAIDDIDFWRCVHPDEYKKYASGEYYVEKALFAYHDSSCDPAVIFDIEYNMEFYILKFIGQS